MHRNKLYTYLAVLIVISFFSTSCTHYYYGPNSANVPLIKNKTDIVLSGGLSLADETAGGEIQSAFAVANHVALMGNFYYTSGKDERTSSTGSGASTTRPESGNGTYGEIGAGYYTLISPKSGWVFETYGGVGLGGINNKYEEANQQSKVGFTKIFIQPSIGFTDRSKILDLYLSSRFSFVNLKVKSANISSSFTTDFENIQAIKDKPNTVFWEPSVGMRLGGENLKVNLQLTFASAFQTIAYNYQFVVSTLGITFRIKNTSNK